MPQGKLRSVDTSHFAMVPKAHVPRSAFDTPTSHKTTFDSGYLIPVYVDEILPGDSVRLRMTAFGRLATPIVPVMDNLWLESFFFFVPNRLVWSNWARFCGEQESPTDTTEFLIPTVPLDSAAGTPVATIYDYFGVHHQGGAGTLNANVLPFRAYNRIWNDFFRDEDLQTKAVQNVGDGPDATGDYTLLRRGKRHDYFTSARPWPQKPHNNLNMGLLSGDLVPGQRMRMPESGAPVSGIGRPGTGANAGATTIATTGSRFEAVLGHVSTAGEALLTKVDPVSGFPDLRVLINDIRTANVAQLWMERDARGGTRYTEKIRAHFGVTSPDQRLQRPEYLGGGRTPIIVKPVEQTSASGNTGSTTVLGEQAGVGSVLVENHGFTQSFTEHGYIIGLVQVRADLSYQQGMARMWSRRTMWDLYWPDFANLGEQAIKSRELFSDGSADDEDVFGFQERWAEYRSKPARISGRFRSDAAQPLDMWHFSQVFAARPVLNEIFVQDDSPLDRVLQVGGLEAEQILFDSYFDIRMVRCMPMFSIPGIGPRL